MAVAVLRRPAARGAATREAAPDVRATEGARLAFVDLLRAWAVILMIETHVFNALLRSDLQQTPAFGVLTFVNGLVAPAFLFLAGFNFVLAAQRRWAGYLSLGAPFRRQLRRLGALLLVAYALHLPTASLPQLVTRADHGQLVSFFQADILQTIAIGLLVLVLVVLLARTPSTFGRVAFWLAALVVLATPIVWRYDFSSVLPLPIATYLNARQASPFPLFPWSAYVFAGACASQLFLASHARESARRLNATMANVFCVGLLLLLVGPVAGAYLDRAYPRSAGWSPSPGSFAVRLGIVLIVLSAVWLRARGVREPSRASGVLQVIGRESLLVYCLHLVVIYGWLVPLPWRADVVGPTLGPLACAVIFLGVTGFTCSVAYGWHLAKTRHRAASGGLRFAFAAALSCFLLIHAF